MIWPGSLSGSAAGLCRESMGGGAEIRSLQPPQPYAHVTENKCAHESLGLVNPFPSAPYFAHVAVHMRRAYAWAATRRLAWSSLGLVGGCNANPCRLPRYRGKSSLFLSTTAGCSKAAGQQTNNCKC